MNTSERLSLSASYTSVTIVTLPMKRVKKHIQQMLDGYREKLEKAREERGEAATVVMGIFYAVQEAQTKTLSIEGKSPEDEDALEAMRGILEEVSLVLLKIMGGDAVRRLKELKDEICKDAWGRDREVA